MFIGEEEELVTVAHLCTLGVFLNEVDELVTVANLCTLGVPRRGG